MPILENVSTSSGSRIVCLFSWSTWSKTNIFLLSLSSIYNVQLTLIVGGINVFLNLKHQTGENKSHRLFSWWNFDLLAVTGGLRDNISRIGFPLTPKERWIWLREGSWFSVLLQLNNSPVKIISCSQSIRTSNDERMGCNSSFLEMGIMIQRFLWRRPGGKENRFWKYFEKILVLECL